MRLFHQTHTPLLVRPKCQAAIFHGKHVSGPLDGRVVTRACGKAIEHGGKMCRVHERTESG